MLSIKAVTITVCLVAGMVALANCQRRAVQPVAITAEDTCSYCKMDISEKRFAAELIDSQSQAFKFDDFGCMANFLKQKRNKNQVRAHFAIDFNTREWIRAENAFYVRSSEVETPMRHGIIAFKSESAANQAAAKYHGARLRFDEVLALKQ